MKKHAPKNVIVSWSSGKDSALALSRLLASIQYRVVGLFTTFVGDSVPFQVSTCAQVKAQAQQIGLPLILIELERLFPEHAVYQNTVINGLKNSGLAFDCVAFGDMYLNGIAEYRKSYIEPQGWQCVFPLLGGEPLQLANEIIEIGIKAHLVTVDSQQLDGAFLGRNFDAALLSQLPASCDPCGENGEFHTFVSDAPYFAQKLHVNKQTPLRDQRFHHQPFSLTI
ncbi:MAG: ATPase [Vibrionaceae bacterium]